SAGKTDTGKTRKNNEDSYLVDEGLGLYAVADGIGGHEGGEVASRMAIEGLSQIVRERCSGADHSISAECDPAGTELSRAFTLVNGTIRQAAAVNPALLSMGTTMTALLFRETTAHLAHVGDSRAYRLRAGVLTQVTDDHTIIADQVRAGLLTPEQAQRSPYRHVITRALGIDQELIADLHVLEARPDDTFLLCTDGLTEMVDDAEIRRILSRASPQEAAERLVREANDRGGVDNITVVVVQIKDSR
ncbi:MAG TPA: Stp1/IreP family PP2C-type Ser/Thr phosphatase, partial [Nitrospirota bacterium]|nr:Stp1/IreP family PP2C-type Ser/Thr phosphatase [Nitrospirota bacterium]